MNIQAIVVSQLKKQREGLVARLAGIDAALAAFGGSVSPSTPVKRTRKTKKPRSQAQIDAIKKAQDARREKLAARGNGEETAPEPEQPKRESKPRLPQGPPKGASLAEAAS